MNLISSRRFWVIAGIGLFLCGLLVYPSWTPDVSVEVSGYERSDGTYVDSYYRTAPDETEDNNLSTYRRERNNAWIIIVGGASILLLCFITSTSTLPDSPVLPRVYLISFFLALMAVLFVILQLLVTIWPILIIVAAVILLSKIR